MPSAKRPMAPPKVPAGAVLLRRGEDFALNEEGVLLTDAGLAKCAVFGTEPAAVTVDVHLRGEYLVVSRRDA